MNSHTDDRMPADIRGYHQRTKHAPNRYALGPSFLDWTSQPSPYRLFEGCRRVSLPLPSAKETALFPGSAAEPAPLDHDALGLFLELAFGLSAWKNYEGSTWALRNNPSSGNLHPTEAYLVIDSMAGVGDKAALYHYAPLGHELEERAIYAGARVLPARGFALALSSIPWREAWKYGERAFRYCQLDAGHAIGSVAQAAAALGWSARLLPEPSDEDVAALLGLTRADAAHRREPEHPDLLLWVATDDAPIHPIDMRPLVDAARIWRGTANRLSEDHDGWPLVDLAAQFCRKPRMSAQDPAPSHQSATPAPDFGKIEVADVVRRRRSAQRFDGEAVLPRASFSAMLAALAPGAKPLLAAFPWAAALTLLLFVHRVDGVEPGLYALERNRQAASRLRAASPAFDWAPVDLDGSPLYRLRGGAVEKEATRLACLQPISGKGCFSLAMVADFDHTLREDGAFGYRRLHWEAGLIGQSLYLWATAAGLSGTGIGCFFDDEVHALLGLPVAETQFQDLYHFTVGAPIEDPRILTLPAYSDERRGDL
ncbi:SagB-type dehydrogenase domain-containing protein [Methylocella tundrae]|uniref:SagB-type dehydrogenase domain-containing protein n=1 Tax=Methylocella tundrae TaxID=227605 RepID=A0A8B6MAT5_METTU|nr:SagB/ThcOx family dehydrogenase [Methylocella tundrae]VTZ23776.1 Nitroreductase [Methylocella tundrae]VTZ52034.1 SagB-type dehydrogenase domain-containing protein [Methylocella tundrae]